MWWGLGVRRNHCFLDLSSCRDVRYSSLEMPVLCIPMWRNLINV